MERVDAAIPPVSIVRRKRQRTMRIRVKDDAIIVSGPSSVSERRLLQFAEEKREWIRNVCLRRQEKVLLLMRKREQAKGSLLLRGIRKQIYDFPVPGLRKPVLEEREHAVVYRYNPMDHLSEEPLPSPGLVMDFYRQVAKVEIADRYDYWKEVLPFAPARLSVRNQRTKWGSCSARGAISLNWRLIKCPTTIMDYIIIHEFCHLRHFNHSRAFWETLGQHYPGVAAAKKWIREHSEEVFADF